MKSIRTRLFAILLVGALGLAGTGCGSNDADSASSSDSSAAADAESSAADDSSAQDSGADDSDTADTTEAAENDDSSTGDNAVMTAVGDGEMLRQDLTITDYEVDVEQSDVPINPGANENSSSSGGSSGDSNSGGSSNNSSGNSDDSSTSDGSSGGGSSSGGDSDGSTYTPSLKGKLLYWLDTSQMEDYVFNGDFVDVTFRVKDDAPDGNYTIGIGECDFANWDAETLSYVAVDGDIAIGDAQQQETGTADVDGTDTVALICQSAAAQQGEEVVVRFFMENNPGMVGLIFRFTYDENILEYVSYDVGADCADYITLS